MNQISPPMKKKTARANQKKSNGRVNRSIRFPKEVDGRMVTFATALSLGLNEYVVRAVENQVARDTIKANESPR